MKFFKRLGEVTETDVERIIFGFLMLACIVMLAVEIVRAIPSETNITFASQKDASAETVAPRFCFEKASSEGKTGSSVRTYIVTDTVTGVEYLFVNDGDTGVAVTPLYNEDGSLRTADDETAAALKGGE